MLSAPQVVGLGKKRQQKIAVAIGVFVLLVLLVSCSLALAAEGSGVDPEGVALPVPRTMAELDELTEGGQIVSADPVTDPVAAEELPHADLGREEAGNLLTTVFPAALEEQAGVFNDLEVEAFRSDNVAVVPSDKPGGEPGLLSSLLPLRVENERGEKEVVSLELQDEGAAGLAPVNPLVDVQLPDSLDHSIRLPKSGIGITVRGLADRSASTISETAAFYPNVESETDLSILPVPTGVETLTQLRSPEAPATQHFALTLPAGAELRSTADGGAVVSGDGEDPLLVIRPPSAIDANGDAVPVSMEVSGSEITLTADPASDAAYPILVDPVFESYSWKSTNTNTGIYTDWRSYTSNSNIFKPGWIGTISGQMYSGLALRSSAGSATPGTSMNWNYYVPRYFTDPEDKRPTSYIRNMTLSQVYFILEDTPVHTHPYMLVGLWDENRGAFAVSGTHNGGEEAYNGVTLVLPNTGEYTTVKNGGIAVATSETASYPRQAYVGSASVEVTDNDFPEFGEIGGVEQWVSSQPGAPIVYSASDRGLGVQQLRLRYAAAAGGQGEIVTQIGCTGAASSPCPRTITQATKQITYNPGLLAQGENWVNIYSVDPIGHWSEVKTTRIKVDRVVPELGLSGALAEQSTLGTKLAEYPLKLSVKDGSEATASALSSFGTAGQIERPMGAAADAAGNIWVADTTLNRVVEYDKNGTFVRQLTGSPEAGFGEPRGVAIAPNGNIWVAEKAARRFQQFTPTGTFVSKFTNTSIEPYDIAFDAGGGLWVTDPSAKKVYKLSQSGSVLKTFSIPQPTSGLAVPYGIGIDNYGNPWVAIQGTNQIMELDPNVGSVLFSFGSEGTEAGQFKTPFDVAIAPSGNIFVTDSLNNRIQEFKPDGGFMRQFGTAGTAANQLSEPRGISVAPGNILMISDAGNKRVARWSNADRNVESGAAKTEIKVDNALVDTYNPGCAAGKNCSLSREWVMKADNFSVGAHKVEVIATDAAGNATAPKILTVETHGDLQAPSIALSGTMTEQATLGSTRPTYKLKEVATDTGTAEERKSGVASTSIKVDGTVVDSSSPGCPAGGCSITREWTLNSSSYSAGTHTVEVKATDAAGRSTTKTLSIKVERDTIAPQLTLSGALPGAPEGWVQDGTRSAIAEATDEAGYGVKQIRFQIDGVLVGESLTQTCEAGGCPKSKTFWIDMTKYSGGAHEAVMIAEDLAGNIRKKTWTINLDPEGHISASEAIDTLEALDATSPVNTVGAPIASDGYEGTSENLFLESVNGVLVGNGPAAPISIPEAVPGQVTVEVPTDQAYANCPNRPAEEAETSRTGAEEEQLALTAGCSEPLIPGPEDQLAPITAVPIGNIGGTGQTTTGNDAAAVAGNIASNVDMVTRPLYDGAMMFSAIRDSSAPETYSWEVRLHEDQQLMQVDSKTAKVQYPSGPTAFTINAIPAHDAIGTTVPTHITVSGNVLTLTVEHRSTQFVYPVVGGAGWEGGFQTYQVQMPSGEEAGELTAGQIVEDGEYQYHEVTVGPPENLTSTDYRPASAHADSKKRKYNFHDCRFDVAGYNDNGPGDGLKREGIHACHGEEEGPQGGYYTIRWAVSVHGKYFYDPHEFVWLNARPECEKWGPSEPAKVNCFGGPANLNTPSYPNIDVVGDYRFAPGKWGGSYAPWSAVCFRISGRLPNYWVPEEGGGSMLMSTYHTYRRPVEPDQKCDYNNLDKIQ